MRSLLPLRAFALGFIAVACVDGTLSAQPALAPQITTPSYYAEPSRSANAADPGAAVNDEAAIRATAIALNYCRASFHRIRKYPVKPVLAEEQEKILNNLNLQGIEDPEVIALYTSVLDEISQIQIADRERYLTRANHSNSLQRKMTWDVLAFSADLATGQLGSAVKQGANSWWDYRGMEFQRDQSLMAVEKNRLNSVTQKSSTFLDTFWKLARRKNIPDRWLVRGDDLDSLELAQREQDPETRLRILKRMEPYMQAYPPYWYYVAKTEQELGELVAAADTYFQLARIGDGHFRKDDMLATSLANLAAIQDHLGSGDAVVTAHRALDYSPDVWEANLICSRIMEKHGQVAAAEDAILRNLDVQLEREQSLVFLASLYYHSNERTKLARMLQNQAIVASLPAPVLLRCAACLGVESTPPAVMQAVVAALDVQRRTQFNGEELQVRLSPTWQLHLARLDVAYRGQRLQPSPVERANDGYQIRYSVASSNGSTTGNTNSSGGPVNVRFVYPDQTQIDVALQSDEVPQSGQTNIGFFPLRTSVTRGGVMKISSVSVNNQQIAVLQNSAELPYTQPVDVRVD
ncbi:MAG: tetratricopeptide repeat protein [Planctomycetaceae bacterium]